MSIPVVLAEIFSSCSEVEKELGMLFSKGGKWKNRAKQPEAGTRFQMLVEDIREGVLVSICVELLFQFSIS